MDENLDHHGSVKLIKEKEIKMTLLLKHVVILRKYDLNHNHNPNPKPNH